MAENQVRDLKDLKEMIPDLPRTISSDQLNGKTFIVLGLRDKRKSAYGEGSYALIDVLVDGQKLVWETGAYRVLHILEHLSGHFPVRVRLVRKGREWDLE